MSADKLRLISKVKFTSSQFIIDVQKLFAGRVFNQQNRYQDQMSPRPGVPPNLPPGCHSSMSNNYYHKHDARRLARTPISIDQSKLSESKESIQSMITPGSVYNP